MSGACVGACMVVSVCVMCKKVGVLVPSMMPLFLSASIFGLLSISFFNLLRIRTAEQEEERKGRKEGEREEGEGKRREKSDRDRQELFGVLGEFSSPVTMATYHSYQLH